jgi:hypothetical protein
MTSFLIIDDHPLFRDALGNAIRGGAEDELVQNATRHFVENNRCRCTVARLDLEQSQRRTIRS